MRGKKNKNFTICVTAISIILMIGALYACSYVIQHNLRTEMQNTLRDVSEQGVISVNKEMESRFILLNSLSEDATAYLDTIEEHMEEFDTFVENYGFIRIGFINPEGITYTTDGYSGDLSFRDFFQKGMEGQSCFTDTMQDALVGNGNEINVFSVPVYNKEHTEVAGVLYATYPRDWFQSVLDIQSFEGEGSNCVIKEDGTIVAVSENCHFIVREDFFAHLEKGDSENIPMVTAMKSDMEKRKGGILYFWENGKHDVCYVPLELNVGEVDWYMLSIVPEQILTQRMQPMMHSVDMLLAVIVLVAVGFVVVYLMNYRKQRAELIELAYTDSLTKGDNFACFQEKMKWKRGMIGYIIAMDIEDFKVINDTCGMDMGDATLLKVWEVLKESIEEDELAARIYADRFILFLQAGDKDVLAVRLEALTQKLETLAEEMGVPRVSPVFGIYKMESEEEVEKVYGHAIQAKHLVKGRRDRNYAFYEELDAQQILENRALENGFERAIKEKEFEVWYQPKFSTEENKIVGAEALIRWKTKDGTLLSPGKFIPLFEKNGMIPRLDEYVFREVCRQQKQWEKEGRKLLPVSVNISRVSLYYCNIVEKYKAILDSYQLNPEYVQLEITESATIDNGEISWLIEEFHQVGFHMLLDDFGSGYSSLSTLNVMHFDTVKLDKSLIDYIGDNNGEKLLHYITRLGQNLGLHITAEGVETKEQVEFLRDLKCDDIQGYYFSKPIPCGQYEKALANG